MFQVKGVVDTVHSKSKTSKAGRPFNIHYITVDGVEISTGFKPLYTEGQAVNIAVEKKYGEWQVQEGVSADGLPPMGSAPVTPVATGSFGGKGRGTFPVETTDGQMSIIRQSSMNRAVELVRDMIDCGTLEAPKDKDEYLHTVVEVALIVTDFGSGQDIMQLKAAQQANKVVNQ